MTAASQPRDGAVKTPDGDWKIIAMQAMEAARRAQTTWGGWPVQKRLDCVKRARQVIARKSALLAGASGLARSRPVAEALTSEVLPLLEACRFLEREAVGVLRTRTLGPSGALRWLGVRRSEVRREPLGVILIIGPGNYPLFLPGVQLVQALVAGNAVVLKPGKSGGGVMTLLREILVEAGLHPDLLRLLPEAPEAGRAAIEAGPDKVVFTGSAEVGAEILRHLSPRLIPAVVELSGCDAAIVRADADLDLVVEALVFGLRLNGGATCIGPRRLFVHRTVATELEGRLARALKPAQCVVNPAAARLVAEAVAAGAHFLSGSVVDEQTLQTPLVLAGVSPGCQLMQADPFCAVLSMVTVSDDDEAIFRADDCSYALGASIFTRDEGVAQTMARRLGAGVVTINDLIVPTADARLPFGGRGRSGFGVTRGPEGLLELTRPKAATLSRGRFRPAFKEPRGSEGELFSAYIQLAHGGGLRARLRALLLLFQSAINSRKSAL